MVLDFCYTALFSHIIPLVLTAFGIGFLIGIHEFGHFIFSKLFGIAVPTFSIGFGPQLWKKTIGGTRFRIALIPLGGYCEIAGLAEPGQGDQEQADDRTSTSFDTKPYWQKVMVMLGGILFNLAFAYIAFISMYVIGMPQEKATIVIASVEKSSAARTAGLQKGDILLGMDEQEFTTDPKQLMDNMNDSLLPYIRQRPGKMITLHVERKSKHIDIPVTLAAVGAEGARIGQLGASFAFIPGFVEGVYQQLSLGQAISEGIERTNQHISLTARGIASLFYKRTLRGAGGPVMLFTTTYKMAQQGITLFLLLLAVISIGLALINVLPLGILDGGRLLLVTIEALTGKRISERINIAINMIFLALFALLIIVLSYRDIMQLFFNN